MQKALFAGSFDPPTRGHLKILERASRLCQMLCIGVGLNSEKQERLFSIEESAEILRQEMRHLPNIEVRPFTGLTSTLAKEIGASFFIRGLRQATDLPSEMQMAGVNQKLCGIETVFLLSHAEDALISASLIRELAFNGAPLGDFLPPKIAQEVLKRIKNRKNSR